MFYPAVNSCHLFKNNENMPKQETSIAKQQYNFIIENIKNGCKFIEEFEEFLSTIKTVPDVETLENLFGIRRALDKLDDTCLDLIYASESRHTVSEPSFYTAKDTKIVKEPETVPVENKIIKETETVPVDTKIVKEPEAVLTYAKIVKETETVPVETKIVKEPGVVLTESKFVKEPEVVPVDTKVREFRENEVPLTDRSIFNMDYPTLRIPQETGPYSGERLSKSVEKTTKFSPNPSNCTYFKNGECKLKEKCLFYHPGKHSHRLLVSEAITSNKNVIQALKLLKEGKTDDKNTFIAEKLGFGSHVFVSEKKLCLVNKQELDEHPEIAKFHLLRTFINGDIRQKEYVLKFVKEYL